MYATQRQKEISDFIKKEGGAQVSELSRIFQVSEVTIRTDLRLLEQTGTIERKHGGAIPKAVEILPFPYLMQMLSEKKTAIAHAALSLIQEKDNLFLDASSTVLHLALLMRKLRNITVVSNSIPVFELFKEYTEGTLIGIPGNLNPLSQSFIGSFAEQMISSLRFSKVFISPRAIIPEGLRDTNIMDAAVRKRAIDSATETIVLADHSKFLNSNTLFGIDSFDPVNTVITDRKPDEVFLEIFEKKRIQLIIADVHGTNPI